jgi:hypothetical protein
MIRRQVARKYSFFYHVLDGWLNVRGGGGFRVLLFPADDADLSANGTDQRNHRAPKKSQFHYLTPQTKPFPQKWMKARLSSSTVT